MENYNGYTNHKTWNIALHLNNDPTLYGLVLDTSYDYKDLVLFLHSMCVINTIDNVYFDDRDLNISELDILLQDIRDL